MTEAPIIDVAAWIGAYPFRSTTPRTVEALEARMAVAGVDYAVVSAFESLFWEDNLEGFRWWKARLLSPAIELWPVVNPSMPGQLRQLRRLVHECREKGTPIRGIRLLPNYHSYRLWDSCTADLMHFCQQEDLIVQVFQRIADERWHWMLKVPAVADDEIMMLINQFPANRILISGHNTPQALAPALQQHSKLFVDISRVRGPVFAILRLVEQVPWRQLVLGSLWPIQIIEATLWQVQHDVLEPEVRAGILGQNAQRMFAGRPNQPEVRPEEAAVARVHRSDH